MSTTISSEQLMMQMGQMKHQLSSQQMINHQPINSSIETVNKTETYSQKTGPEEKVQFSALLGSAINQVNKVQKHAGELKNDFEMGKEGVNLVEVMIASEKSSVAFSALLESRNKLMRAYTTILNTRV